MVQNRIERRDGTRYRISLAVSYEVTPKSKKFKLKGMGRTCDISKNGMLFRNRRWLEVGSHISLLIKLPSKSTEVRYLAITGFVTRSFKTRAAVAFTSYKIRHQLAEIKPAA